MRALAIPPLAALLLLLAHTLRRAALISRAKQRLRSRAQCCSSTSSRSGTSRDGVLLAQSFHAPLYVLSASLLLLRVALYILIECDAFAAVDGAGAVAMQWKASAFFWLLEMPSVLLIALAGYLVLFYASVAHLHRWVANSRATVGSSSWISAAFVAFCVLLSLLAMLFACLRGALLVEEDEQLKRHHNKTQLQRINYQVAAVHAVYSALVWGVLALLLLKYQAKCTQFLWRERRQHRLRALNATALHAMAVGSTLLAMALLLRAVLMLAVASEPCTLPVSASSESSTRLLLTQLLVQYVGWELVVLCVLFRMLSKIPIAYDYPVVVQAVPCSSQVEYIFQLPKLRDLVEDFVVTTSHSLQQRARLERYDRLFYDEERHSLSSRDHPYEDGQAHVALLSEEYPVGADDSNVVGLGRVAADEDEEYDSHRSTKEGDEDGNTVPLYFG